MPLSSLAVGGYKAVAAGYRYVMVLKEDGALWGWGYNSLGELGIGTEAPEEKPVKILDNVRRMACGNTYTMVVRNDGSLWCFGRMDGEFWWKKPGNRSARAAGASPVTTALPMPSRSMLRESTFARF